MCKNREAPWAVGGRAFHDTYGHVHITAYSGKVLVANIPGAMLDDTARANAEFIVRACNNFHNLMATCKEEIRHLEEAGDDVAQLKAAKEHTTEALSGAILKAVKGGNTP